MDAANEFTDEMSQEEILKEAIAHGNIDMSEITDRVNEMKREQYISQHPREVWRNSKGEYLTYIYDENGHRQIRRRKTKEEMDDFLARFYKSQEPQIFLDDVFKEWSDLKLRYHEIQKESYDRYVSDYQRFFKKTDPICRKKFKNITENDLEKFIRIKIADEKLSRHAYSGLVTIIRGIFKYGKKQGYTEISISQFISDLEIPRNAFRKVYHPRENETFSETDLPQIVRYLKENPDIWNMGLMLQFQSGLRIGEIAALKSEDIGEDYIHVCRTEYKYRDENGKWKAGVKDLPKTEAGFRDVILPPQSKETLEQIRKLNPDGEYLFMNKGKRIRENTFNKRLTDICDKLGIIHHTTHKIRKTYGTMLLDNGVEDGTVAEMMGHTDVSTTRKLYYYSNKSRKTKSVQIAKAVKI